MGQRDRDSARVERQRLPPLGVQRQRMVSFPRGYAERAGGGSTEGAGGSPIDPPTRVAGDALPPSPEPSSLLARSAALHDGRLCPRQILGVRTGLHAASLLGMVAPRRDKRLLVIVETDGCFADGIAAATGCRMGRRTLRLEDYGKVAATAIDTATGRAVRVWPHPEARARAGRYAPHAPDRWHAQLIGYRAMPASELLQARAVVLTQPLAALLGRPGQRVTCARCGEEILNGREVPLPTGAVCAACAGTAYYRYD